MTTAPAWSIGVALKWVPLHVEVDPLTGMVHADARFSGCSAADRAALEWALRMADRAAAEVVVATAGPVAAEALLRDAIACGATRAVRVEIPNGLPSDQTAEALSPAFDGCALVVCGDHSLDRGSASVPAFLAAHTDRAQALGLVHLDVDALGVAGPPTTIGATRRLDFGRREVLRVPTPAVVSVEGGTAELRRAPLGAVLAARSAPITTTTWAGVPDNRVHVLHHAPYRPRARVLPPPPADAPPRDRILALTGASGDSAPSHEVVDTDAAGAADVILERLRQWGYLA